MTIVPVGVLFHEACRVLNVNPQVLLDGLERRRAGARIRKVRDDVTDRERVWLYMRLRENPPSYPAMAAYFGVPHSTIVTAVQRIRMSERRSLETVAVG